LAQLNALVPVTQSKFNPWKRKMRLLGIGR